MKKKFSLLLLTTSHFFVAGQTAEQKTLEFTDGTAVKFTTPAPVLWNNENLPVPVFDSNGSAQVSNLELKRFIEEIPGGYRIKLTLTNNRKKAIMLKYLIPFQVNGQGNLQVGGTKIDKWQIFRLARHKNDIPGPFRPTVVNDASKDAAIDSAKAKVGAREDISDKTVTDTVFHSDPGLVIMPDRKPESNHLFIGFDGQTGHLNDITLKLDPSRKKLADLTASAEFDGIIIPPGETRETHYLYIMTGKSCRDLLSDHVERIRKKYGSRLASKRNVFCTWYFYGPGIVAGDLRKDLAEIKRRKLKFDIFLIDYNWDTYFGDWDADPERFPDGMKAMADEIKSYGLTPGIWTCPFIIDSKSEALKKYPDLVLKNRAGKKIEFNSFMGHCYVIDPTSPSAEKFLSGIMKKLISWGYGYLKFDFLRAVVIHEDAVFHDHTATRAQAYKRGIDIMRKAIPDDVMVGTWGGLFEANAGFVNINRPGSDVRGHWDPVEDYGYNTRYPVRMRQTFARAIYDEKLWTSDQDALQLRRRNTPWRGLYKRRHIPMGVFTDEEAFSTVVFRFLGGGVVQVSEKLDEIDQDRADMYNMVLPTYAPVAQYFYGWNDYLPEYFVSHFNKHETLPPWAIVSLCNWNGKQTKKLTFKPADVPGLPKAYTYAAFEFKTQKFLGVFKKEAAISLELPPHSTRVIRLTPLNGDGRYLIGGNLNMSCGMEIKSVDGEKVMLRDAVRDLAAKFTFLNWKNGSAVIKKIEYKP